MQRNYSSHNIGMGTGFAVLIILSAVAALHQAYGQETDALIDDNHQRDDGRYLALAAGAAGVLAGFYLGMPRSNSGWSKTRVFAKRIESVTGVDEASPWGKGRLLVPIVVAIGVGVAIVLSSPDSGLLLTGRLGTTDNLPSSFGTNPPPEPTAVRITVRATDQATGLPISNAFYSIRSDGNPVSEGLTSADGTVILSLDRGDYEVVINADRYAEARRSISVVAERLETISLVPISETAPSFSLSLNVPDIKASQGSSVNFPVKLSPTGGFVGSVTLSTAPKIEGIEIWFDPNPVGLGFSDSETTMYISVTGNADLRQYPFDLVGTGGGITRNIPFSLTLEAPHTTTPQSNTGGGSNPASMQFVKTDKDIYYGSEVVRISGNAGQGTASITILNPTRQIYQIHPVEQAQDGSFEIVLSIGGPMAADGVWSVRLATAQQASSAEFYWQHSLPASQQQPSVNLFGFAQSSTTIGLNWNTDYASAVSSFKIYRNEALIATLLGNVFSYSDTGVEQQTTYSYRVGLVAQEGGEYMSNTVQVTIMPPDSGTAEPSLSLVAEAQSPTDVRLEWNIDSDGISQYQLYRDGVLIQTLDSTAESFTDTGLEAMTEYNYKLKALLNSGNEIWSNEVTVTTGEDLEEAPHFGGSHTSG